MRKICLLLGSCILLSSGWSQTINNGMLYISPQTKFATLPTLNNNAVGKIYNDGELYFYSHFNNDGEMDFYQDTGTANFVGNQYQDLEGQNRSHFYNINFNNSSSNYPFHLYGYFDIYGTAHFNKGILDNYNYGGTIAFANNSEHNQVSNTSHVNGEVIKIGKSEFTFPIGNGSYYRPAGISAPGKEHSFYQALYRFENSDPQYPHEQSDKGIDQINTQEYWIIKEEESGSGEVLVTLSWNEATTPTSLIQAAQDQSLTIVRWDHLSNRWIDEGGAIDISTQKITTVVSGFGPFTLGRLKIDKPDCEVVAYSAVTPNGDGKNDFFHIDTGHENCARNLYVKIFNRWGLKVFESANYGQNGDVFDGFSTGRLTIGDSNRLPSGTYYYLLEYETASGKIEDRQKKAGFLYLSGN